MNCRRVQKNLSLYVEGDLDFHTASKIDLHLEQCGRCNWLFDEYKESQNWLRSDELPEFDEARLRAIKSNVLTRIDDVAKSRSLLASLGAYFSRRYVLALSAAMVILSTAVVLYLYQQRGNVRTGTIGESRASESVQTGPTNETKITNKSVATLKSPKSRMKRVHSTIARTFNRSVVSVPRTESTVESESTAETTSESVNASTMYAKTRHDSSVLRIEIQTSDPKIRIIWFAPKETDSHQTKPDTD